MGNERCAECGATDDLHRHHIDGDHDNDVVGNLQWLCCSCHARHHAEEYWASPANRASHSAALRRAWADPERRARWIAGIEEAQGRPEVRAKRSAIMRRKWRQSGYRERVSTGVQAACRRRKEAMGRSDWE